MMSSKLAFRNVKKSFRDYSIYFLTLMFGVCIFYVFNSIESQQAMMDISSSQSQALKSLNRLMGYVSVFVSVILGFLIIYANRFLIRQRKKELGIYQTLGMQKGQISRILVIETFLVALFSLLAGLAVGVFLSQGFAVVTASLFEVKLKSFTFIFSPSAAIKSMIYFGISFLLVMVFNSVTISRQKLIDLIYAERKNEKFKTPHLILSVVIFIIAIICLVLAYNIIIKNGLLEINNQFWTSIILGIVGTFLFFFSLSGFFLKVIQQSKKIYLKNLNMFVLRQINSKINTTYISMTMVCLMLFISICTLSSGMGISKGITANLNEIRPYDATYSILIWEEIYNDATREISESKKYDISLMEEFNNSGIDVKSYAKEIQEVKFYQSDVALDLGYVSYEFMKISDYNILLAMQGKEPVTLSKDEFIINSNDTFAKDKVLKYFADNKISLYGIELSLNNIYENVLSNLYSRTTDECTFVVADEMLNEDEIQRNLLVVNYIQPTDKYNKLFEKACEQVLKNIRAKANADTSRSLPMSISPMLKINLFEVNKSISATVAYLAVYVGIVFLLISAAVLAITQLSEASDNIKRYSLLRKIGTDNNMLNKALFMQIAVYFGVPILLAIIHSFVGITVASKIVEAFGDMNILRDSLFAASVIAVIYGGYFTATYLGCKNIVNKK